MRVYFAGSIRGGRDHAAAYGELIAAIGEVAEVLTEHVSGSDLCPDGEEQLADDVIYARDMDWLAACDAVVAEVTQPSLGVGYEIGAAEAAGKPILALHAVDSTWRLSAMVAGNPRLRVVAYGNLGEAELAVRAFLAELAAREDATAAD